MITELKSELLKIDSNEEKLQKDKLEREEAARNYEEAQRNAGDVK